MINWGAKFEQLINNEEKFRSDTTTYKACLLVITVKGRREKKVAASFQSLAKP